MPVCQLWHFTPQGSHCNCFTCGGPDPNWKDPEEERERLKKEKQALELDRLRRLAEKTHGMYTWTRQARSRTKPSSVPILPVMSAWWISTMRYSGRRCSRPSSAVGSGDGDRKRIVARGWEAGLLLEPMRIVQSKATGIFERSKANKTKTPLLTNRGLSETLVSYP